MAAAHDGGDGTLIISRSLEDLVNGNQNESSNIRKKTRLIVLIIFNLIIISIILIIRFAHPQKPKFHLQDATVFIFNLSSPPPNLLNSTLQITLASQNPNKISSIYYDDLGVYAEYKEQQITFQTAIPRVYQNHKESNVWSLFINGGNIAIAPYNVPVLSWDLSNGFIKLVIKVDGHVRWKIGSFTSRKYHFHVVCKADMDFRGKFSNRDGDVVFSSDKYMLYRRCAVDV